VYSEIKKGTEFRVYFPACSVCNDVKTAAAHEAEFPQGNGATVLVVDDDEAVRLVAKKTLEKFGYQVCVAQNGAEAVSLYALERDRIAMVLTDMAMPIMDGAATAVALKTINPELRVIGTSGLTLDGGGAKLVGTQLDAFITKPYRAETLLNTLYQFLPSERTALASPCV
jgi:CheY-like chemotaxis protein